MTGLLYDTSIFIGLEQRRAGDWEKLPTREFNACVITYAELYQGVLAANDTRSRSERMNTLAMVDDLDLLTADRGAAAEWAGLRVDLKSQRRSIKVNDLWIAAIAKANQLAVVTQDDDFDALAELGLLDVLKV